MAISSASNWPPHPDDQWLEVHALGDPIPRFVLVSSGAEREIEHAKTLFALDRITLKEFESVVDRILLDRR